MSSEALTSIVPSASVNPLVSSIIANLTSALPTGAQPTGAVPTALPSIFPNGTVDPHTPGMPKGGLTLKQILEWIAWLLKNAFKDIKDEKNGSGKVHRAHARDIVGQK